ncbi:MAG: PD-(D/E)XK nuclease family protein, partial [Clostridia bacterium]|nr:PD-(D/E)XK nuclease family protein [Clostridia bacterium]
FVLSVLGVSVYGATYRTVAEVVNNAYFPQKEGVPAFLSYVKRAGVVGNRFYQPFTLPLSDQEQAEGVRSVFADLCPPIKERGTAGEYLAYVSGLMQSANVMQVSAKLTEEMRLEYPELADFTRQAPERFLELLAETERILGNTPISVTEFCDVISSGLQAVETSVLPTRLDAVTVAPPDKACVKTAKYVYAVGMTSDFPAVTEDTAFLSERDLLELEEKGVSVDPNLQEMNERARALAVYALTTFTESLVLSYPAVSFSGEANTESELITLIKRNCFSNGERIAEVTEGELIKIEDSLPKEKRFMRKANGYITETSALERYFSGLGEYAEGGKEDLAEESGFYTFTANKDQENGTTNADKLAVDEALSDGLRGGEEIGSVTPGAISATAIQTYFSCPYKYFLSKTLGVQEPQEMKIAANESGTLMHAVYEAFGREMTLREVKAEEIPALVKGFFEEVLSRPDFAVKRGQVRNEISFQRLLKEAERGCIALYEHFSRASLKISAVEKNLLESFDSPALAFAVGDKKIPLTGVVDRIDEDETFFRIVDYKTGNVKCSLSELYTGRHLQLELYLIAVQNLLNKRPVGGYYFFSRDTYEETPQPVRLYGKTVKEENALYAQDRSFAVKGDTPQESIVLPYTVSINKKGETQYKGDGAKNLLLSEEDFSAHLNYAFRVAQKALTELESGFIYPTPYEGGCKWCKYQSICGRSADFYGEGRKVTARIENQDILLALSEEEVNEDVR